ncbi:hypothetical protein [Actinokineospora sp.]|uniref:hypothetical protein n=1 Tax=Actinokineospora sp. TaxID=1872133 RepID=UPI003D6BA312
MDPPYGTAWVRVSGLRAVPAGLPRASGLPADDQGKSTRSGRTQEEPWPIDPDERRVRFLALGAGGFLGIGKKTLLVAVAAGPVSDPELKIQRDYFEDVYGYYGVAPYWLPGYPPPRYPYL